MLTSTQRHDLRAAALCFALGLGILLALVVLNDQTMAALFDGWEQP